MNTFFWERFRNAANTRGISGFSWAETNNQLYAIHYALENVAAE